VDTVDFDVPDGCKSSCNACCKVYIRKPPAPVATLCHCCHYFHVACVKRSLERGDLRCPTCRRFLASQPALDKLFQEAPQWKGYCELLKASKTDRSLLGWDQLVEESFETWENPVLGPEYGLHMDECSATPEEEYEGCWDDEPKGVDRPPSPDFPADYYAEYS